MEVSSAAIVAVTDLCVKTDHLLGLTTTGHQNDEAAAEPENLADYAPSEKTWDQRRAQADAVEEIYRDSSCFPRYVDRISDCAQILDFAWVEDGSTRETGELRFKLRSARFCHVRTCPVCQWRRSLMLAARFRKALEKVLAQFPPSSVSFLHLTLTVKNCPVSELRSTLRSMGKAWNRLAQRKEFEHILGFVKGTEVTRSKDHPECDSHPHYHVLLMVRNSWFKKHYVSHAQWAQAWKESARLDYYPQVRIQKVRSKGELNNTESIIKAAAETLKYAVKPDDAIDNPAWFVELTRQIKSLHFLASGGVFKGALRENDESEQGLLLMEDEKSKDQIEHGRVDFKYARSAQVYKRRRVG